MTDTTHMALKFDIIDYVADGLTGYTFTRKQVEYIVMARGVEGVTDLTQLTERDRDLLTADCLRIIYTTPSQSASESWSHGDASQSHGTQYISDKKRIFGWMMSLYRKWGENPFPDELEGCVNAYNILDDY